MTTYDKTFRRWQAKQLSYLIEHGHQEIGVTRRGKPRPRPNPRFIYSMTCATCDGEYEFDFAAGMIHELVVFHFNHNTRLHEIFQHSRREPSRRQARRQWQRREFDRMNALGATNAEIAERLGVSARTASRWRGRQKVSL